MKGLLKERKEVEKMQIKDETQMEKLKKLYDTYKNRMYISACRILNDPQKAEDAVHDSFIAISRNIEKLDEVDSLKTASYCIKAAKNTALNQVKKSFNEIPSLMNDEDIFFEENMLDMICSKENYRKVVECIMSLDEKYRDVLSLYYLNELTVPEIADLLSRKEGTVKQQLARGRHKLINIIEKETE